jgi:hypothetical protein
LDFVAALFALADYVCDAAEYAFAFLGAAFVAVEDVGAEAELEAAGSWFVRFVVLVSLFSDLGEMRKRRGRKGEIYLQHLMPRFLPHLRVSR